MALRSAVSKNLGLGLIALVGLLMVLPAGAMLASGAMVRPTTAAVGPSTGAVPASGAMPSELQLTTPSEGSVPASQIPAQYQNVPWIASLDHTGPHLATLASLPNLALLEHPLAAGAQINPFYVAQPAPLGLTDFGLGATPYSYNTSHIVGSITFAAPPNDTDPGSTGLIEPSGASDGYVGSVYEFGIQLNTVAANMSIPGSDNGVFWTQNVVDWNDTGIHFVSDTFNMTSATQSPYVFQPGTIYSACGLSGANIEPDLVNYGGVFQCVGGTVPISPASYPVTIQLYNNASINAQKRTQVAYGYRITEAGTHTVYTGVSDTVVFNNPTPLVTPANKPVFSIDGFTPSPTGLFRDAEIVLCGDIGGDESVFRSINATLSLEYSNLSAGGWKSVPSAYNFGGDTGETATGVADYWTPSHTLVAHQGPAMLYGLWGTPAYVSVRSGDIHVAGTIHPSFGFVFVSNTKPVLDPFGTGEQDNMSWLPTTDSGTFNTYLPPLGAPWTTAYHVQGFAAGYAEKNGTAITGSTGTYSLTLAASPGTLNAPLYMFSNAQASAVAKAVTGVATPPYDFSNLVDNINFTFNHVDDYGFPTFVLLMAQGVTQPIVVNNTYEGFDSPTGAYYITDYPVPTEQGLLAPPPANTSSLPGFTGSINIYDGINDRVTNQTLEGDVANENIVLWQDQGFHAASLTSFLLSPGVWIGDSVKTVVTGESVFFGGNGLWDVGSAGTVGSEISVSGSIAPGFDPSVGVEGYSSSADTFSSIAVTGGGIGVITGEDYGAIAGYDPYYYLPGTTGLTVRDLSVSNGSEGANVTLSRGTTISGLSVFNDSLGVVFDDSPIASVSLVRAWNLSTGVEVVDSKATTISRVDTWNTSTGVSLVTSKLVDVSKVTASVGSIGVMVVGSTEIRINFVNADDHSIGVFLQGSSAVVIHHVTARHHSISVYVA